MHGKILSEEKGKKILLDYLPQLEKEYDFWMKGSDELGSDVFSSKSRCFITRWKYAKSLLG